jgi:hypothetical protein
MFIKSKRDYLCLCPSMKTATVDLEGLICFSTFGVVTVDEHLNVNKSIKDGDYTSEPLYFEF